MPPPEGRSRAAARAAGAAIVVLAAVLRFWALDMGLPHPLTRPDEEIVLGQTGYLARGDRSLGWAVYPPAYLYLTWGWGVAGLRAGEALGLFPAADYRTVLRAHRERLLLVGRALSALAGTAAVAVLLAAACRGLGAGAALAGGLLLATCFLHARDSHALKPDALLSLWVLAALAALARVAEAATPGRAAAAGAAIGCAMATKYPAVLLLVPAWVATGLGTPGRGWRRLVPPAALLVGGVAAAVFLVTSPALVLDPRSRDSIVFVLRTLVPAGWPGAVVSATAVPADSAYAGPWWGGWVYHATFSLRYGWGVLPALAALPAVVWGLASRRPLALLAAVFALVYYGVLGAASPVTQARYMTPLMPVLALLEGGLVAAVAARVAPARRGAVVAFATVLLAAESLAATVAHDRIAARTDTRVLAARWIAAHVPPGRTVAIAGTQMWGYGAPQMPPGVRGRMIALDAEALARSGATYLVTHDHPLPFSRVDPAALAALAARLHPRASFDPFRGDPAAAVFERADAYYIPMHGFAAVERPGPRIRIYEVR